MRSISLEEYIAETQDFCSMSRKENTIPVIEKPALPGRKPVSLKYSYGQSEGGGKPGTDDRNHQLRQIGNGFWMRRIPMSVEMAGKLSKGTYLVTKTEAAGPAFQWPTCRIC